MPWQRLVVAPLVGLSDLTTYEQRLLARVRPHVSVQRPQVRELLPVVAGHLLVEGSLAVDYLVMREGEDEVLTEGVHHAEREFVVVIAAVDWVASQVTQRVVHPAHVPLEDEAATAPRGGG